ncbi:MAG: hypothetical protein MR018_01545 [Clostridiales bacterium]|nr:hypothetical protein [Clostridiales bacterium]MDD7310673.1 hypothetical protein [Eubacteriales bacterium]
MEKHAVFSKIRENSALCLPLEKAAASIERLSRVNGIVRSFQRTMQALDTMNDFPAGIFHNRRKRKGKRDYAVRCPIRRPLAITLAIKGNQLIPSQTGPHASGLRGSFLPRWKLPEKQKKRQKTHTVTKLRHQNLARPNDL